MATLTSNADVIEDLMNDVRSEIGNAGFAAQLGHLDLTLEALDEATQKIADAREVLLQNR